MRTIIFILTILLSLNIFAQSKNKKPTPTNTDQIYTLPGMKAEIALGNSAPAVKKDADKKLKDFYYVGLVRSDMTYRAPSFVTASDNYSPSFVGVSVASKMGNAFYLFHGNLEIGGEWQTFEREVSSGSQKVNLFQANVVQNIDLSWSLKDTVFFSAGLGISPVYLTAEKSVVGNSLSSLGALAILKFDLMYPFKYIRKYELDLSLRLGWGKAGSYTLGTTSFLAGVNFE